MPRIDDKRLQELADKTIFARTNEFNDYVLRTIGRRIKATGRASAADQTALNNMRNISGDMAKIKKKLAETMELNVTDVEAILTQTVIEGVNSYKPLFDFKGAEFIPFEQNEYAKFLVNHWAQETCEKMINLSRTKALCFDKYNALGEVIGTTPLEGAFQQAIDEAVMAVSTGTTDFNTAMKKTVERLGGSGVRVDYGNNITRGLPGMVRSNLLYGAKQAAQAYDEYVGEKLGCNGFEVDYHPGPRPTHAFMGGVMYSYNGDVVIDGVKYEDGSEALERLKDYGCLHFKMDVILGVSEPRYDKEWLEQQKKKDTELIEYNGKQKTMYQWKQGARRLETAVREQRDIAFMAKESGIKSLENQAKGKIADYRAAYDDLCDKVGIEKRYDRMATYPSKTVKQFNITNGVEQNYKAVSKNVDDSISFRRGSTVINASKLSNTNNGIYVSDKVTLKPKQQHILDNNLTKAKKALNIQESSNLPRTIIVDSSEMSNGVIASYNPVDNILRIDSKLGLKELIPELQKDGVLPNNELSTIVHELIHWQSADRYRALRGDITAQNAKEYLDGLDLQAKKAIDKLEKQGYNVSGISFYAKTRYDKGMYDETYTEYQVLKLLGGK